MKYITQDSETGTIIDEFDTIEEAELAIAEYEKKDKEDQNFCPNFYEIYAQE